MKEIHPIALCYPKLSPAEYEALKADIKKNGLLVPIVLYQDKVLDGNHRQRACEETGVTRDYVSPEIQDPYAYVVSLNERRRHLTTGQRAVVAERMATLKRGTNRYEKKVDPRIRGSTTSGASVAVKEAATLNKVGMTSVDEARYTKERGIPELYQALEDGKLKPYRAKDIARLSKPEQPAALQAELAGDKSTGNRKRSSQSAVSSAPRADLLRATQAQLLEEINAPSIYPSEAPLPVHPKGAVETGLIRGAIKDLREQEGLIGTFRSAKELYDKIWHATQCIQSYALDPKAYGGLCGEIDRRWVRWAKAVVDKVRAREEMFRQQEKFRAAKRGAKAEPKPARSGSRAKKGYDRRIAEFTRALKKLLRQIDFVSDERDRLLAESARLIGEYFEDRDNRFSNNGAQKGSDLIK